MPTRRENCVTALTFEEARERSRLPDVRGYRVDLDVTGGGAAFGSATRPWPPTWSRWSRVPTSASAPSITASRSACTHGSRWRGTCAGMRRNSSPGGGGESRLRDVPGRFPVPVGRDAGRPAAASHGDRARDGAHVVRRPGHHALVERRVAERVVRHVHGLPGPGGRDRLHRNVV